MKVTGTVKEYRQLKKTGYCLEGSAEHKSKSRAYEQMKITENTATITVTECCSEFYMLDNSIKIIKLNETPVPTMMKKISSNCLIQGFMLY